MAQASTVLMLILCMLVVATTTFKDQSIDRLNHGVRFEYKQTIKSVTATWRHTIAIHLPINQFAEFDNDNSDEYDLHTVSNLNQKYEPCRPQSQQIHKNPCLTTNRFTRNLEFLTAVATDGLTYLHQLSVSIKDLLPAAGELITDRKDKRALLGFMGTIFKGLFGTSTEEDYQILANHVKQIAETQNTELTAIKKFTSNMNSFVIASTKRLDALTATV